MILPMFSSFDDSALDRTTIFATNGVCIQFEYRVGAPVGQLADGGGPLALTA
jgi:hypothetical protein